MTFLKSYIHFENEENNIIFDNQLQQITGRTETMGIEETVLEMERERGIRRGIRHGMKRSIERIVTNMLHNNFSDEMIVKATAMTPDYVKKMRMSLENK